MLAGTAIGTYFNKQYIAVVVDIDPHILPVC